ncbi:hypothetical protein FGB62_92g046 [Gracilaria domingensis]|nr:hypothetical protein FGB62_92g046 [Gracilaria domingensis]
MQDDFTAQFLRDYKARVDAAHERAQERARRVANKRKLLEEAAAKARDEAQKARIADEVVDMFSRVAPKSPWRRKKGQKKDVKPKATTPGRKRSSKATSNQQLGVHGARVNYRAPRKARASRPPPKLGEDMEFVVRRPKEKKEIKVPHTSDYSDMFGGKFWLGVELGFAKKSAKETAEAKAVNEKIIAEQQADRKRRKQERIDFFGEEKALEKKGLLDGPSKSKRRLEFSDKDWVAVDVAIPTRLQKGSEVVKQAQKASTKFRKASARKEKAADGRIAKERKRKELDERARRLRERILALGASTPKKASNAQQKSLKKATGDGAKLYFSDSNDSELEKPRTARKAPCRTGSDGAKKLTRGKLSTDVDYSSDDDGSVETYGSSSAAERKRKRRWEVQGDDSEEYSDDGDLYDIAAIDREEEESARIARMEDKQELEKLRRGRREKAQRRREFEQRRG